MRTLGRIGKLGLVLLLLSSLPGRAASPATPAPAAGPLDGKTFAGETGEVGKATGDKDGFVFKDGTFRSTACDRYGFKLAPYTAANNADGSISFGAITTSPKEGKMTWKGTVKGEAIDGTISWSKAGQKTIDYWFKGTLKKTT